MTAPRDRAVAAITIGATATNLLVVDQSGRHFHAADTMLGRDVGVHGRLAAAAMDRTIATLQDYRRVIDAARVDTVVVVATSATREAANRDEFLDAAERALGRRPVVIPGEVEGRLGFWGVASGLPPEATQPLLVLDIGGLSTQFTVGDQRSSVAISADVGSIRLTEAVLRSDPPRAQELTNAIGLVHDHLDDVLRALPSASDVTSVVGIGGTIATAAAVEIGSADPERLHCFRLSRPAAEDVFRTLATEPVAQRRHNPGLAASRTPIVVGGLCVLVAVMRRLHLDDVIVSGRTLLDGICADLASGGPGLPAQEVFG